jgi:hypothetical protein
MGISLNYDRQVQERIACALERIEQLLRDRESVVALPLPGESVQAMVESVKPRRGRPPKVANG